MLCGMTTRRSLTAFYAVVALIALAGQALAAVEWLGWPLITAITAVAALELGGVVLSQHALARMQLGETATAARLLSAAVAGFAVAFNWLGHADHRQGAFFAGMSALGYLVWLLDSAARRRDRLRQLRMLAEPPPSYGLVRWLRRPMLTWEARALAIETPTLGLHRSLEAAAAARRATRRRAAIAKVLHRKIRAAVDPTTADIATAVYDMDQVADRLAAGADYDRLTAIISVDLDPARITGVPDSPADTIADSPADTAPVADMARTAEDIAGASGDTAGGEASRVRLPTDKARTIAQSLYIANPDMPVDTIADMIGMSARTVRRYLAQVGRPTSAPPALDGEATAEWPLALGPLDPDAALAQLNTVADPVHRRHLADVALGGPVAVAA